MITEQPQQVFSQNLRGRIEEKWCKISNNDWKEIEERRQRDIDNMRNNEIRFVMNELCEHIEKLENRIAVLESSPFAPSENLTTKK